MKITKLSAIFVTVITIGVMVFMAPVFADIWTFDNPPEETGDPEDNKTNLILDYPADEGGPIRIRASFGSDSGETYFVLPTGANYNDPITGDALFKGSGDLLPLNITFDYTIDAFLVHFATTSEGYPFQIIFLTAYLDGDEVGSTGNGPGGADPPIGGKQGQAQIDSANCSGSDFDMVAITLSYDTGGGDTGLPGVFDYIMVNSSTVPIPEPASLVIFGIAAAGIGVRKFRGV